MPKILTDQTKIGPNTKYLVQIPNKVSGRLVKAVVSGKHLTFNSTQLGKPALVQCREEGPLPVLRGPKGGLLTKGDTYRDSYVISMNARGTSEIVLRFSESLLDYITFGDHKDKEILISYVKSGDKSFLVATIHGQTLPDFDFIHPLGFLGKAVSAYANKTVNYYLKVKHSGGVNICLSLLSSFLGVEGYKMFLAGNLKKVTTYLNDAYLIGSFVGDVGFVEILPITSPSLHIRHH